MEKEHKPGIFWWAPIWGTCHMHAISRSWINMWVVSIRSVPHERRRCPLDPYWWWWWCALLKFHFSSIVYLWNTSSTSRGDIGGGSRTTQQPTWKFWWTLFRIAHDSFHVRFRDKEDVVYVFEVHAMAVHIYCFNIIPCRWMANHVHVNTLFKYFRAIKPIRGIHTHTHPWRHIMM